VISYPNAKINLGLSILRKREDGFHDIESVFYPVPWKDMLEIVPQKTLSGVVDFSSSGIEIPFNGGLNLCEKVYNVLHNKHVLPSVRIHLHKQVPIGAGLGGGSADAAFAAVMFNEMFNLQISDFELEELVSEVGSDCPFFVQNKPTYVTGRGEILEPFDLDLSGYWVMLVNPNIHIGTAEAYAGIIPRTPEHSLKEILSDDVDQWKGLVKNDFEDSIFKNHPEIKELKTRLYDEGADYAAMSGSGSTVFGLFQSKPQNWDFSDTYSVKIAQM
jgi:4-diphosphocytidyl-2-C-methyl-D-erythritol kinase